MPAQQGFRAINNEPFVYQENSGSFSAALGLDSTNVYSISVVGSSGASPNPTSQINIDPTGNTTVRSSTKVVLDGFAQITSLTAGFVQSDSGGNLSIGVPGGGVTDISGTTDQIDTSPASPASGSVTLSVPTTFTGPGYVAATTNFLLPSTTSSVGNILWGTSGSTGRIMFPNSTTNTDANVFLGQATGNYTLSGVDNVGAGYGVLNVVTSGSNNIGLGNQAMVNLSSGSNNVAISQDALGNMILGQHNVAIGFQALKQQAFPSGTSNYNIGIGFHGGFNFTNNNESSNICLNSPGVTTESNTMRLGAGTGTGTQQLNKAYISGIYGITPSSGTRGIAMIANDDQLGSLSGAAGTVLVGGTTPSFATLSGVSVTSITGTANQVTASASVGAVTLSTPSTFIAPGTIASTTTNAAGTNFLLPVTSSSAGQITQSGTRIFHTFGTSNFFAGASSGNFTMTGTENVCVGAGAGTGLVGGSGNVYVGYNAGNSDVDAGNGGNNTAVGHQALGLYTGAASTPRNTAIGSMAGGNLLTGNHNTFLGYSTASNYTGSESNNVTIGYDVNGTLGESNVLRIGKTTGTGQGSLNKAVVCGIQGITVTGTAVLVSSSDQLGVAVSSRRFKDNIQDMETYSSGIYNLRPVTFTYNVGDDQSVQAGLIAEEVNDVMPQLVVMDQEGLPQTVKYHDLPALLLNEIQKLNKRIESLEARL